MSDVYTFTVLIEREGDSYGASVPDLPGVFSRGGSLEEVERNLREAIELWLEEARQANISIPQPKTEAHVVKVLV
jgi:predicted RNase H-like HicB family nuclease